MTTLEEVWEWYEAALSSLRKVERLASRFWDDLPWDGPLGRDRLLGGGDADEEAGPVARQAGLAQQPVDDLAVVLLFSVFEATVRGRVADSAKTAADQITNPFILGVIRRTLGEIDRGSFAGDLEAYSRSKSAEWVNLSDRVRQVRRYRNWITHGRRGKPHGAVDPKTARDALTEFLNLLAPPDEPDTAGV